MDEMINSLEEIYEITLKQESAVKLGMVPRFMRLLDEKQKKLELIDSMDVEKNFDMMYDECKKEKIKELLSKINDLNTSNIEKLKDQKKDLKIQLDKITKAKTLVEQSNGDKNNLRGQFIDNKK